MSTKNFMVSARSKDTRSEIKVNLELYGVKTGFKLSSRPLTPSAFKAAMERIKRGDIKELWIQ